MAGGRLPRVHAHRRGLLSSFTTKTAVYVLARSFAGTELLLYIGAAMAMFPIFYAVIENDLRRVLGYSMINQIGFMVVGVGLGPGMGVNGAVAHAFNDVLFKGLLFMSMGAVLYRTGRINGSDLGGLYKSMPLTCGFCMVEPRRFRPFRSLAALSASPWLCRPRPTRATSSSGYCCCLPRLASSTTPASKSPSLPSSPTTRGSAAAKHRATCCWQWVLGAALCIGIGSFPHYLYSLLPYPVDYNPYDATHIVLQLQLLFFSALAFVALKLTGIYPPELRSANIDVDWTYRKLLPGAARLCVQVGHRCGTD